MLLRNAGIFNPVLVQAVGLCPVVAIATSLKGAALLALVAAVVITLSELIASLFMKRIERWVRIALYILLGGALVLPFMMFIEKNEPELFSSLGLYLPIMAVNSLVVLRCERFAVKIKPFSALRDGLTASFGYAVVLLLVGLVREALGSGSVAGFTFKHSNNLTGMLLPFGGFVIVGFFAAVLRSVISAYWPRYLDKKQPKPHAKRKRPKQPAVEQEPVLDLTPDETPFSLDEIEATPFGAEQPDGITQTDAEDAVYVPIQPEPKLNPEPKLEPKPELKPELKPILKPEPKPELKPEPKPILKPEPKPEPKPVPKPELKPILKPEPKPIQKPTPRPVPLETPKVGDVFTKPVDPAARTIQPKSPVDEPDEELEALFNRSLDDVLNENKNENK